MIPSYIKEYQRSAEWFFNHCGEIHNNIQRLYSDNPDVTIIIPAYNEENNILRTIASLSKTITQQKIEILVVNNNSTDRTQELIERSGVNCFFEARQGVKHARNSGLRNAKGRIILNADADSVYSPFWVDMMSLPLKDISVACTYGSFAFFPDGTTPRIVYFLYETLGDIFKRVIQRNKDKAMYVYGCSSGYRKANGLSVEGYEHPPGANEDGYLALKLRNQFGKLYRVANQKSLVWTSDRKLQQQGGIWSAFQARVKRFAFQQ